MGYQHTIITKCPECKARDGMAKTVYQTEIEALDCAKRQWIEHRVDCEPYPCPHGHGWHLRTKR